MSITRGRKTKRRKQLYLFAVIGLIIIASVIGIVMSMRDAGNQIQLTPRLREQALIAVESVTEFIGGKISAGEANSAVSFARETINSYEVDGAHEETVRSSLSSDLAILSMELTSANAGLTSKTSIQESKDRIVKRYGLQEK